MDPRMSRRRGFPSFPILICLVLLLGVTGTRALADDEIYEGEIEASLEILDEGENLRERGRFAEAATKYWEAVDADLQNYRAYVRYLDTALAVGDPKIQMVEDLDAFIEDYPKLLGLQLHKLRLTQAPAERMASLGKLLQTHPDDANLHLELGRASLAQYKPGPALESLVRAAALAKAGRTDILLILAETEYKAGKTAEARARLDRAVAGNADFFDAILMLGRFDLREFDNDKSLARAASVIALRPGHIAATLLHAEATSRVGQADDALKILITARREHSTNQDVAIAYADLLAKQESDKAYATAEVVYKSVLAQNDESVRAFYGLGWLYERSEKWEEAEKNYREVVLLEPNSFMGVNSIGYVLYKQGRISDAQVQFKKAMDLNPDYVTAMLNLGATYDIKGKYNDGIKLYEKVLKKAGWEKNLRAMINCAFDYEALGVFPKALRLLMEAHKYSPKDPMLTVWIGDNHYFQKKFKKSIDWYRRAIALKDDLFFAWRGLGFSFAHQKQWEDAVKSLGRANKIKPDDLDILIALGDINFYEVEDLKVALDHYLDYVQRGGDDPAIRDLITEIQKRLAK